MFDIGWTEILILAVISLFVIGPKDIPKFLGYIGKLIGKVRGITSEFRETVDDAIKNSEYEKRLPAIKQARELVLKKYNFYATVAKIVKQKNTAKQSAKSEKSIYLKSRALMRKNPFYATYTLIEKVRNKTYNTINKIKNSNW